MLGLVIALAWPAQAAAAGNDQPDEPACSALEAWAAGIDGKDRVKPVEGNRGWMPRAFQEPAFAELFGLAAMDWTSDQARDIGSRVLACGKAAAKAGRSDAAKALYAARGYFIGNLRGLLVVAERQAGTEKRAAERKMQLEAQADAKAEEQAKREARRDAQRRGQAAAAAAAAEARASQVEAVVMKAVDDFLAEQDRLALLRRLQELHGLKIDEPQSFGRVYGHLGYAGNTMLDLMRRNSIGVDDSRVGPKLAERERALRNEITGEYAARIDALEANGDSLRFLARWQREVAAKIAPAVGAEEAGKLQSRITEKSSAIRSAMLELAKKQVSAAANRGENARTALERIERTLGNAASAGLDPAQIAELKAYAATHQTALAEAQIQASTDALDDFPETLDAVQKLAREIQAVKVGVLRHADEDRRTAYIEAVRKRLTEVAEAALPEYERGLAAIPASAEGLRMTQMTLVEDEGFRDIDEEVRADYLAALKVRQADIVDAVKAARQETIEAAVAAGGDPDLVGYLFIDTKNNARLRFSDEKQVVLQINGKQGIAGYEIDGSNVRIMSPGIHFVFQRSGKGRRTRLSGLGLDFERTAQR